MADEILKKSTSVIDTLLLI